MTRATLTTTLALLLSVVFAACGGGGDDTSEAPDTDDPVAVAVAYYNAWYGCGDEGKARQWELRASNSSTREEALQEDQEDGCVPARPPEVEGFIAEEQGEQVAVSLRAPSDAGIDQLMVLVELEGEWRVDDDGGLPLEVQEAT